MKSKDFLDTPFSIAALCQMSVNIGGDLAAGVLIKILWEFYRKILKEFPKKPNHSKSFSFCLKSPKKCAKSILSTRKDNSGDFARFEPKSKISEHSKMILEMLSEAKNAKLALESDFFC